MNPLKPVFLVLAFLLCGTEIILGQDTLYRRDKGKLVVKILEVNSETVKYSLFGVENPVEYHALKSSLVKIVYKNGAKDVFAPQPVEVLNRIEHFDSTRHFIAWDISKAVAYKFVSFSYEYIFAGGKAGIRVPVTLSNGNEKTDLKANYRQTLSSYGFALHWYIGDGNFLPGKLKYFVGLSYDYITFRYQQIKGVFVDKFVLVGVDPNNNPLGYYQRVYTTETTDRIGYKNLYLLKFGCLMRPWKHVNFSVSTGAGWRSFNPGYDGMMNGNISVSLDMNVGFKF